MSEKQPNIVFFFWDNFGWGTLVEEHDEPSDPSQGIEHQTG